MNLERVIQDTLLWSKKTFQRIMYMTQVHELDGSITLLKYIVYVKMWQPLMCIRRGKPPC